MAESPSININPIARFQAYLRTLYDIPFAPEIADQIDAEKNFRELAGPDATDRLYLAPLYEARYKGADRILRHFLEHQPMRQVLELASGLSPQGLMYARQYYPLTYVETDLAPMTQIKARIIRSLTSRTPKGLHLFSANCLQPEDLQRTLVKFKPDQPVIIFNIGLLSFLADEEKTRLAEQIHKILERFGGYWITPDPAMHNERRREISKNFPTHFMIEQNQSTPDGRSFQDNAFADEAAADRFFDELDFTIEKEPQLQGYELSSPAKLKLAPEAIVRIEEDIRRFGKVWILSA